jgi:hypothetical protein
MTLRLQSAISVFLFLFSSLTAIAQSSSTGGILILEYIGSHDRYISPVIIATSIKDAEEFRKQVIRNDIFGPDLGISIIDESTMTRILQIPPIKHRLARDKQHVTMRLPVLSFSIKTKDNEIVDRLPAFEARALIENIEAQLAAYPDIKKQLSDIYRLIPKDKNPS